jgi:hypothetical protein
MLGTSIRSRILAVATLAMSAILLTACGFGGSDQATSTTAAPNAAAPSPNTSGAGTSSTDTSSNVTPTQNAESSAVTLSWQPPTQNTNGSALTDLSGYQINYGTQPDNYTTRISLDNPGLSDYVVDNLPPGTYYFTIAAVASDGTVGAPSAPVTATVD